MNVAEAAARYRVSKQAIYGQLNKLKDKGKNNKTGQLTDEAITMLDAIYQGRTQENNQVVQGDLILAQAEIERQNTEIERFISQAAAMQEEINRLNELLNAQKQANEVMAVRFEASEDKVKALISERDYLREQLNKAIVPALPAPIQQDEAREQRGKQGDSQRETQSEARKEAQKKKHWWQR